MILVRDNNMSYIKNSALFTFDDPSKDGLYKNGPNNTARQLMLFRVGI